MTIFLLSLALAAITATTAPPPQPDEQTIIVTGRTLGETDRALRECLARKWQPTEETDAPPSHAENLFVAGKYADARRVTRAAMGRNHRYRKDHPIDVSDLYRANSRIAAHLGEGRDYEYSTGEMHRILTSALPRTDPRAI